MTHTTISLLVFGYILGCAVTSGITNGVRDGAEGIADEFKIVCWPLFAVCYIPFKMISLSYKFGKKLRTK